MCDAAACLAIEFVGHIVMPHVDHPVWHLRERAPACCGGLTALEYSPSVAG